MNSLHIEACEPQMKIAKFMYAVKHNFANTTMNLTKDSKTSTKQLQGSKKSKKMAQDPSSSTKSTSNSNTDSAYNTESESNYTECLPRPSKCQQITNTKCIQGTKPSCIPVPNHTKSNSKISTSTCLQQPSTSTRSDTQTTVRQPTIPAPKTSTASTYPQRTRKAPLLPTPPASTRNFNYSNHHKQHISRPSAFNNRNPTFTRPPPSTTDFTTHIQPFQDQQTTDTTHNHYFQDHHANTRTSSQDHICSINSHKDTAHSKYLFHHMFLS